MWRRGELDDAPGVDVSLVLDGACISVLDLGAAFFELFHTEINPFKYVHGFEAGDDDGRAVFAGDGAVFGGAHDGADMAGGEETLHTVVGGAEDGAHRRRHQHVRGEDGEIFYPGVLRLQHCHAIRGGGGFEADREENDLFGRVFPRNGHGIER
jgi:hypothetical protein